MKKHVIALELFYKPISITKEQNLPICEFKEIVLTATANLFSKGLTLDMVTEASHGLDIKPIDIPLAIIAMKSISEYFYM